MRHATEDSSSVAVRISEVGRPIVFYVHEYFGSRRGFPAASEG